MKFRTLFSTGGVNIVVLLVAGALISLTLGISYSSYKSTQSRIYKEHLTRLERETTRLAAEVDNRISTLSLATKAVAKHIRQAARGDAANSALGTLHPYLIDIGRDLPALRTIVVMDPSGVIRDDLRPNQPGVGIDVSDRGYMSIHMHSVVRDIHIAEPVVSRVDGKWTWPLSVAVRNDAGSLLAVVLASVDERYFGKVLDRPVAAQQLDTLIVHRNGTVLQASRQMKLKMGQRITNTSLIDDATARGSVLAISARGPFGRPNLVSSVTRVRDWPLFIVNLLDHDVVTRKLAASTRFTILFSAVICLLIFFAALIQVRHNFQRARVEDEIRNLNAVLETRVEERTNELRAAQAELVSKERLATLGRLAATISHELRNPLGAIGTSLAVVDAKIKGYDLGLERAIERMKRSIGRCDRIIAEMLDYTRDRDPINVPTDIDAWLADLMEQKAAPDEFSLEMHLNSGDATINLDPERFRRAIINLVENARDAMLESKRNGADPHLNHLTVETCRKGDFAEITIGDNGPGMPAQILAEVFEPLFSTKSFGIGLGLPIVRKIIEQHKGTIAIDSAPGTGTRVTLSIPVSEVCTETCQIA